MEFIGTCVGWPEADVYAEGGLVEMIDKGLNIEREEFVGAVGPYKLAEVERSIGYDDDFRMENDWHVGYFVSELHGKPCWYFKWSAIEHVFQ